MKDPRDEITSQNKHVDGVKMYGASLYIAEPVTACPDACDYRLDKMIFLSV